MRIKRMKVGHGKCRNVSWERSVSLVEGEFQSINGYTMLGNDKWD